MAKLKAQKICPNGYGKCKDGVCDTMRRGKYVDTLRCHGFMEEIRIAQEKNARVVTSKRIDQGAPFSDFSKVCFVSLLRPQIELVGAMISDEMSLPSGYKAEFNLDELIPRK